MFLLPAAFAHSEPPEPERTKPPAFAFEEGGFTLEAGKLVIERRGEGGGLEIESISLEEPKLRYGGCDGVAQRITVVFSEMSGERRRGEFAVAGLSIRSAPSGESREELPLLAAKGEFTFSRDSSSAVLRITGVDRPISLIGAAEYKRANNLVQFRLSLLPVALVEVRSLLEGLGLALPAEIHIDEGTLSGNIGAEWRESELRSQFLSADLAGASGRFRGAAVRGLSASLRGAAFKPFRMKEPVSVRIAEVLFGFTVRDIQGGVLLGGSSGEQFEHIEFQNWKAEMFSGTVELPRADYDLQQKSGAGTISFESISIPAILELYPQERLDATGRVAGLLPIEILPEGVRVVDGELWAQDKGVLNVRLIDPGSAPSGWRHQLGTAAQALRNYHYESLTADVVMNVEGDLDLALSMKGSSPNFQDGRQVNLNITVTENIPALLESLSMTSGISEFTGRK